MKINVEIKMLVSTVIAVFWGFPVVALLVTFLYRWHISVAGLLFDVEKWKDPLDITMYGFIGVLISIVFGLISLSYWLSEDKEE